MEQKDINIYEILKGVEYGTELYTPMCGNVVFTCLPSNNETIRTEKDLGIYRFDKNGRWMEGGEVMLFPSNEMRDWSKFFKKGDVLICYEGKKPYYTIFDGFESNTYRAFKGKFAYDCCEDKWYQNECNLSTNTFHKLNREDSEIYVTKIEERFGGKLNRETLEIEKPQPAFKTFDKVLVRCGKGFKWLPAFFVRDRGEDFTSRYNVLPLHSGKAADFTQCIPYEGHENFAFTDYDFVDLPF